MELVPVCIYLLSPHAHGFPLLASCGRGCMRYSWASIDILALSKVHSWPLALALRYCLVGFDTCMMPRVMQSSFISLTFSCAPEALATAHLTGCILVSIHLWLSDYPAVPKEASFKPLLIKWAPSKDSAPGSVVHVENLAENQKCKIPDWEAYILVHPASKLH